MSPRVHVQETIMTLPRPPRAHRTPPGTGFLRRARAVAVVVATALAVVGCGTPRMYDGPRRTAREVSILEEAYTPQGSDFRFYVTHIDGKPAKKGLSDSPWGNEFEVLPGRHVVNVGFSSGQWYTSTTEKVEVTTVAGHRYRPNGTVTRFDVKSRSSLSRVFIEEVPVATR